MGTYDASWARNVYTTYAKLCPRAQQIITCIQETAKDYRPFVLSRESIIDALTWNIQHKSPQTTWNAFKRLCKRTPLDVDLLKKVTKAILDIAVEVDVEKKQRQFEFS